MSDIEDEDESHVVICVTTDAYPEGAPAPSKRSVCAKCGTDLWVSHSALRHLPDAEHLCLPCGLGRMLAEDETPKVLRTMLEEVSSSLSPGDIARLDQILADLGVEVTDELG